MGDQHTNGSIKFETLPSVTSPKEEKASFKDFSSNDHDKPARPKTHVTIETHQKAH